MVEVILLGWVKLNTFSCRVQPLFAFFRNIDIKFTGHTEQIFTYSRTIKRFDWEIFTQENELHMK
jgi:hypothetical protein